MCQSSRLFYTLPDKHGGGLLCLSLQGYLERPDPAVTRVGLGGEGVLRTYGREHEAQSVIEEAAAQGITYFDCAKAYAGSESYYGEFWSRHSELRSRIFQTSKSASRDLEGAKADLFQTRKSWALIISTCGRFMIFEAATI